MADVLATSLYLLHGQDLHLSIGIPSDDETGLRLMARPWADQAAFITMPASPIVDTRKNAAYRHYFKIHLLEESIRRYPGMSHLLMDSDLLALRKIPISYLSCHKLAAMPAHYATWHGDWKKIYDLFGIAPTYLVIESTGLRPTLPYFNAGFVWMHANIAAEIQWGRAAQQIADQFSGNADMHLFPWLDQISLPIAAATKKLRIHELPDCFNMLYLKHVAAINGSKGVADHATLPPFNIHYHGEVACLRPILKRHNSALLANEVFLDALTTLESAESKGLIRTKNKPVIRHPD